ncbi:hypothetical protein E1267_24900 [Nonomuraea longispora]|uniref:Uncharacterized protein n=1 Tax=Nonomuraea longispora TaxID=1848320 RepID=A0A4R4N4Y4_9ACTN|nr:hypothetical protein E1267_24900 [Nonomuraea longispora]
MRKTAAGILDQFEVESMGGTYHQVVGDDIPQALLDFARDVNATQLVLGASRRGRFAQVLSRGVGVERRRPGEGELASHTCPNNLSAWMSIPGCCATSLSWRRKEALPVPRSDCSSPSRR